MKTKLTKDCFTDKKIYYYRDSNLDNLLPKKQTETKIEGKIKTLEKEMTFQEMKSEYTPPLVSLIDIENFIKERSEELDNTGYANFFFVENSTGGVSVVDVHRHVSQWGVDVYRLGFDYCWLAVYRVFVSNSTLGSFDTLTLPNVLEINGIKYKKL